MTQIPHPGGPASVPGSHGEAIPHQFLCDLWVALRAIFISPEHEKGRKTKLDRGLSKKSPDPGSGASNAKS